MSRATFAARSVGFWVVSAMAALTVSIAPSSARASSFSVNPCVDSFFLNFYLDLDENDVKDDEANECMPATNGVNPIINMNLVQPVLHMLNTYFGKRNVGGPVAAYRRAENPADAGSLAHWVDQGVPGMAAGVTPRESTGEAVGRWIQPLRDQRVNGWFNTTWSSPRDDFRPTRYDSDIWTLTLGADLPVNLFSQDLLFGLFGSFTNSDVDTTFNNGGVKSKIGTVGPYVSWAMNRYVAFDLTVAAMFGEHDNTVGTPSIFTPLGMGSSPKARGDQEFDGAFVAANVNGNYWIGNLGFQGRLGFMHSAVKTDAYNLSSGGAIIRIPGQSNELTQFSFAVQANYFLDQGLPYLEEVKAMPFLRMTFNHDIEHEEIKVMAPLPNHPNDEQEVVISWGAHLFGDGPFSGSVEAGHTFARDRFESWIVSGTVAYAF